MRRIPKLQLLASLFASAIALATLSPRAAHAQAAAATKAPVLVPPRMISDPSVDYPQGAKGDSVVILTLTIGVDGSVTGAEALEGDDPFAAAAIAAARTWRFDPATKDGAPFEARIHFKVTFHPPPPIAPTLPPPSSSATVPSTTGSTTAPPPPPPPAAASAEVESADAQITIEAAKLAPAVTSFSKAEVRELPGAFGDPFRAIEAMPGVTPLASGLPFFYVRGAPPGNVGYYLDGVRVPYLYHVGLGPSVIHPAMVDRVDLYPGGYPARFGRYAGGIVSGETSAPRTDFHGEASIRVFDAGALAESGFADGRGSALLAFRYSYTAAIVSLIAKDIKLDYRDFQGRVTYDLTPKDRVTIFSFGAYDLLGQKKNGVLNILFGSEFYRLDLRYDHQFDSKTTLRYAITLGLDSTRIADQRNAHDRMAGMRVELHHAFSDHVLFRAGADSTLDAYRADNAMYSDPDSPDTQKFNNLFPERTDRAGGLWADFILGAGSGVEITPGARIDYFNSGSTTVPAIDPRLAMRFKITDKFRIVHAYGLAHQAPSFIVPVPGLSPGSLANGLQSAFQTSAGVEADLPENIKGTASVFNNSFFGMTDAIGSSADGFDAALNDLRSRGSAYGFELFLRKRLTKTIGGFFTYTLSRSTRTIRGLTFPSTFDRTHVANLAATYDLGRHWRVGGRLVFYTGAPKVNQSHGLLAPPPTLSPDREPAFYRIDVRLEKRWEYGETGSSWLSFVFEMLNATFHKETVGGQEIGPVTIPSIGIEGGL